jgi:hypothetical protein
MMESKEVGFSDRFGQSRTALRFGFIFCLGCWGGVRGAQAAGLDFNLFATGGDYWSAACFLSLLVPNAVFAGLSGAVLGCGAWCCHTTWPALCGPFVWSAPPLWPPRVHGRLNAS